MDLENLDDNIFKRNHPRVIVRGWGGEPVSLFLYRVENNRTYVGGLRQLHPIGLPNEQVFFHSDALLSTLQKAWKQRSVEDISAIYANIPVDDFACNRYQDNISCSHDQKHISDSESAPSGNNG